MNKKEETIWIPALVKSESKTAALSAVEVTKDYPHFESAKKDGLYFNNKKTCEDFISLSKDLAKLFREAHDATKVHINLELHIHVVKPTAVVAIGHECQGKHPKKPAKKSTVKKPVSKSKK